MEPRYIGKAGDWKRTKGQLVGTTDDGTKDIVELPYEGPKEDAEEFRNQWPAGSPCPLAGYSGLTLTTRPTVRARGPMGYAVLRFEGPADNGSGEESDTEIEYISESRSFFFDHSNEASKNSYYSYEAPGAFVRYTSKSRVRSPSKSSVLNQLEDPVPQVRETGQGPPPDGLVEGQDYRVTEVNSISGQSKRGDTYEVTEYHSKRLEQFIESDNN